MNVNEQHAIVKKSLSQFMKRNIPGANLKKVDQIVLEYVVSILEEASQDESFDVEGNKKIFLWCRSKFILLNSIIAFQEMMSAYINDFAKIDPAVICTWIFELECELSKTEEPKEPERSFINFE